MPTPMRVLDLLDVAAAAQAPLRLDDPARPAAVLSSALLRHRPLPRGNEQVALVATAQLGVDDRTAAVTTALENGIIRLG